MTLTALQGASKHGIPAWISQPSWRDGPACGTISRLRGAGGRFRLGSPYRVPGADCFTEFSSCYYLSFRDKIPEARRGELPFSGLCSYRTAEPGFTVGALLAPAPQILTTVTLLLLAVSRLLMKSAPAWHIRPHLHWPGARGRMGSRQTRSNASERVLKDLQHFKS